MEREMIECSMCDGYGELEDRADGEAAGMCPKCEGEGSIPKPDPRLAGRSTCAVCGRRRSWGCGHEPHHESAALDHAETTDHLLGDCDCFVSRAGYAARFTRSEWRARVASALQVIADASPSGVIDARDLQDCLYR